MEQAYDRPKRYSNRGKTAMNSTIKLRLESYVAREYTLEQREVKDIQKPDYIKTNLM